jgi:hypothetical protein
LPIKVITKITGQSISNDIVIRHIKAEKIAPYDKIRCFLMYDLDTNDISKKLSKCRDAINISSNPCIELWFLLHNKEQNSAITNDDCVSTLRHFASEWAYYKKGSLSERQKQILWDSRLLACSRAKKLQKNINPSSTVYNLIEAIDLENVFMRNT